MSELWAAFLGAIVGGIFSLTASYVSARQTAAHERLIRDEERRADREERLRLESRERIFAFVNLSDELVTITVTGRAGMLQAGTGWVQMPHAAFDAAVPYLAALPRPVFDRVRGARFAIWQYNARAAYLNSREPEADSFKHMYGMVPDWVDIVSAASDMLSAHLHELGIETQPAPRSTE